MTNNEYTGPLEQIGPCQWKIPRSYRADSSASAVCALVWIGSGLAKPVAPGARVERSFAHVCETGGARRSWLGGLVDLTKRYLITIAAHNLGRVLRKLFGMGKPRALQDGFGLHALVQWPIL